MTSTIFFALRSRSSFLLIASTPRYAKRERQTRLLSFCLSVVLRAKKERAHTTARWKGEEKFLKCFSWNERTFELVFFFSKVFDAERIAQQEERREKQHSLKKKRQKQKRVVGRHERDDTTNISKYFIFAKVKTKYTNTLPSTIC